MSSNKIKDALVGLAVGDALGVPVEFKSRAYLTENPIEDMIGYGTYQQEAGTWSDDSSLSFCLTESLCRGLDLNDIAHKFISWVRHGYWTAHNEVFDIGITTSRGIERLEYLLRTKNQVEPIPESETDISENGNGALMRTLPLAFFLKGKSDNEKFDIIYKVSALTHGHIRSAMACYIYIEFALLLLEGHDKASAYTTMKDKVNVFFSQERFCATDVECFERILKNNIATYSREDIFSVGYVVYSLEAALWCVLNNDTYNETVLAAVNLGDDTDTTAAIAGGIAGIIYGFEKIPLPWRNKLARIDDIIQLASDFQMTHN